MVTNEFEDNHGTRMHPPATWSQMQTKPCPTNSKMKSLIIINVSPPADHFAFILYLKWVVFSGSSQHFSLSSASFNSLCVVAVSFYLFFLFAWKVLHMNRAFNDTCHKTINIFNNFFFLFWSVSYSFSIMENINCAHNKQNGNKTLKELSLREELLHSSKSDHDHNHLWYGSHF